MSKPVETKYRQTYAEINSLFIWGFLVYLRVKRPQLLTALLKEPTPLSPATLGQCPSTSDRTKDAYDEESRTRSCTQGLHTERGSLACVTCSWRAAGGRNLRWIELMMLVQMSCAGRVSFCFRHRFWSLYRSVLCIFYLCQMHKHKKPILKSIKCVVVWTDYRVDKIWKDFDRLVLSGLFTAAASWTLVGRDVYVGRIPLPAPQVQNLSAPNQSTEVFRTRTYPC